MRYITKVKITLLLGFLSAHRLAVKWAKIVVTILFVISYAAIMTISAFHTTSESSEYIQKRILMRRFVGPIEPQPGTPFCKGTIPNFLYLLWYTVWSVFVWRSRPLTLVIGSLRCVSTLFYSLSSALSHILISKHRAIFLLEAIALCESSSGTRFSTLFCKYFCPSQH